MTVSKPLLERLVVTKYLVTQAATVLASTAPFSAGIAVGQLQDAVELFLRILAEQFHAQLKERAAFEQIIDAVNEKLATPLTHRSSLNQLNKARVNFKHFALEPRDEDARKLLQDVEIFLPSMIREHLAVDYETLSLASLLGHRRTENWIREAEQRLSNGDYPRAVDAAATALAVFQRHLDAKVEQVRLDRFGRHRSSDLRDLLEAIEKEFQELRSTLDLMLTGINLAQYRLFRTFAPTVTFTMAGTLFLSDRDFYYVAPSKDQASICVSFAIDAALALKRANVPKAHHRPPLPPYKEMEVVSESPIVVYPEKNPEVLRTSRLGECLKVLQSQPKSGFIAVIDDGEVAYIAESAVRDIGEGAA